MNVRCVSRKLLSAFCACEVQVEKGKELGMRTPESFRGDDCCEVAVLWDVAR
jgi:hypothetical protein